MKLQHIELNQLKVSPVNVRKRGAEEDLGELIASIRSLGVIQPLLVRPNCEGFEVIAGQCRLLACQALQAETADVGPLPCAVLENGDDATALEASLAENVARLPMDEIDQYEAFAALITQGRSIADIAGQFGVTELLVKRRLAIASLIPQVLKAYREGSIEAETIQQLTMATPKHQKAWFKLFRDPEEYAPTGRRLKAWLFGAEIPVSSAIFPPERYTGNIVSDLFGEERYFDDAEKFWKLQIEAIIHRQAAYLEEGWNDVVILEVGAHFYQYDKVKCGRTKGGKVYISCAANGEIGFHEGWIDAKEAARREKDKAKAAASTGDDADAEEKSAVRPELTSMAIRYVDLHRQNAVRVELLKSSQIALRVLVASVISRDGLSEARPESQNTQRNETQPLYQSARYLMPNVRPCGHCLAFRGKSISWRERGAISTAVLMSRLLAMSDEEVLRILTFLMAEALPAGSAVVEVLGNILAVDMDQWWAPDETFFELLRDKEAINAMLAEVAGKQTASIHLSETAKTQKDAIRHCLAGTGGRQKVDGWKPRYFRFPMQSYTKRKGLPAIGQWNAVKKHFDVKR